MRSAIRALAVPSPNRSRPACAASAPGSRSGFFCIQGIISKKDELYKIESRFGGDGEIRLHLRLARDGANQSIDQFLNWSMKAPPGPSIHIRISPYFMKNISPAKRRGICFHGGDGEIRPARAPRRHARGQRNMPPACFSRFARALFESLHAL